MSQAWLTIGGLVLDFVGFALIAIEWLIAQRQERTARAIEDNRARGAQGFETMRRSGLPIAPQMQRHMETVEHMQRQQTQRQTAEVHRTFTQRRYAVIYLGMALVVAGFALQLAGAWPA